MAGSWWLVIVLSVSEHLLDGADIDVCLEQMAGETVAESVSRGMFHQFRASYRRMDGFLNMGLVKMIPAALIGFGDISRKFGGSNCGGEWFPAVFGRRHPMECLRQRDEFLNCGQPRYFAVKRFFLKYAYKP